jgi:hypothetical protein
MPAEVTPLRIASKTMTRDRWRSLLLWLGLVFSLSASSSAQTCQSAADMDAATRTALEATAKRYFEMAAHGDSASLKQNAIPSLAGSFAGIEAAVKDNQAALSGAQATVRPPFLLSADGPQPLSHAEFLCGVFGREGQTKDSAVFVLNNLPPGKYAVAVLDVNGGSSPATLTLVLQQLGTDWKLGGFYAKSSETAGHDAAWFAQRARDFKAKSQLHNAALYYIEAIALSTPVDFMSTLNTDKLYDEAKAAQTADLPANGNMVDLTAGGKTYHMSEVFPMAVGKDLDIVVKYQSSDISDTARTFQENAALIKALVGKFPEFREAFGGVVARAVDPSGHDYGTMLAMKDIK